MEHEKQTIVVIEDEADMADLVAIRLRKEGYDVHVARDGAEGLRLVHQARPDLILLDLMLPKMPGLEVLQAVRQTPSLAGVPVVIMSAKGEEGDVVIGLHTGADDYVTKPFSMAILTARIRALLRRAALKGDDPSTTLSVGPLVIDPERHKVELNGQPLTLTRTEFRLLHALAMARGRVLTRDQLIDKAMGADAVVTDRTVDVHLTSVRGKLGEARGLIETVRGVGYRIWEQYES